MSGLATALLALVGCAGTVSGTPTAATQQTSTPVTEPSERPSTTRSSAPTRSSTQTTASDPGIPTVDQTAAAQYCDRPFKGALGKDMLAVVVETPGGILDCENAAAILFDYYAARPNPETGLPPFDIGPLTCNQVPEPDFPQVVCADADNLIYSMWPQT
ncbi:hypothetical protein [Actinokineospora pegani]|uniref:hypothetical protein n=1 Tax=Actinokineospora pegani TaxID=2654637 RepID=UPI0012EA9813|nr:hypothetical protein [Actinokineospora pegani]